MQRPCQRQRRGGGAGCPCPTQSLHIPVAAPAPPLRNPADIPARHASRCPTLWQPETPCLDTTVTTPEIFALGTLTTGVSALVIGLAFALMAGWKRLRAARAARG